MARRTDCVFCGGETGSREHTFPAALGGRRVNKGILCGPCNEKFSTLDAQISHQLSIINGLIGVRPDHDDDPRPGRVESAEGPLTIDHAGKPTFAAPRVVSDHPETDGRRRVSMSFGSEAQVQEWLAEQRAAGFDVKTQERRNGQRFLAEDVHVQLSFGGGDTFREIGRIALNFLAHRWPDLARSAELQAFRDWVEGKIELKEGEGRFVWYAHADAPPPPDSPFVFGHQISVVATSTGCFARVRFFSAFDLFVWFGAPEGLVSETIVFDIDPLADNAPKDVRETKLTSTAGAEALTRPTSDAMDLEALMQPRIADLFQRIEDRQWEVGTQGLVEALNAARDLDREERRDRVAKRLDRQRGRVLLLVRHLTDEFCERATANGLPEVAEMLGALSQRDASSSDGLTQVTRAVLGFSFEILVEATVDQLRKGNITDDDLRALLKGRVGLQAVGSELWKLVRGEIAKLVEEDEGGQK